MANSPEPQPGDLEGKQALPDQKKETKNDSHPQQGHTPPPADSPHSDRQLSRMLDENLAPRRSGEVIKGDRVSGVLVKIGTENSFVDFGGRCEGSIKTAELQDDKGELQFSPGDPLEVFVADDEDEILLTRSLRRADQSADVIRQAYGSGIPVEGKVEAVNKWGLGVNLRGNVRAFCPLSQLDTKYVENAESYRDRTLKFKIIKFRHQGRDIVVSRRAFLEEEENKISNAVRSGLKEGVQMEGRVTRLKSFGAFVDIGGNVEGLIHVSELSHKRVEHPREILKNGQEVKVVVIRLKDLGDKRRERISLSLKALEKDPWDEICRQFPPGTVVRGKIDAVESYGAFVEIAPDVRGMVHVSEVAERRVAHPGDVVSVGDEVRVTVLALDHGRRRLSLSIKQVEKVEADSNLKEFQQNQKKSREEVQGVNAMVDALQRANLIN